MSNCSNSQNSQLKALHARLDRIDDDLIAHYAGISQLVAGLTANPVTAGSVAPSLTTFNFSSAGHTLLKKLMGLVPGYSVFKNLQHLDSASLVDSMASNIEGQAETAAATVAGQVATAAQAQADALAAQATAAANLANGIKQGVSQADQVALQLAVTTANQTVALAGAQLAQVNQVGGVIQQFMGVLKDISSCQTHSSVIK